MVVREEVQRHRGNFLEKAIEGWIVGGSRNVVAVTGQTDASASQVAVIVKMTGFDMNLSYVEPST